MKFVAYSVAVLVCVLWSCTSDTKVEAKKHYASNIIVLLDLSDRIILNKAQSALDESICMSLIDKAIKGIEQRKYHDNSGILQFKKFSSTFRVVIAEQKSSVVDKNDAEEKLHYKANNLSKKETEAIIKNFPAQAKQTLHDLYAAAASMPHPKDYSGADIWKFFNEDLAALIDKDSNTKNYLFILTDGYLYFQDYQGRAASNNRYSSMNFLPELRNQKDWEATFDTKDYGLIPLKKDFSNLHIAVLEVTPHDFWNEYDLLKKVWGKWFGEMGVGKDNYLILKSGSANITQEAINSFLK